MKGWDSIDTIGGGRTVTVQEESAEEPEGSGINWRAVQFGLAVAAAVPLLFIGGLNGWPWDGDPKPAAVAPTVITQADPVRLEMSRLGVDALVDPLASDGAAGGLSKPAHGRVGWLQEGPEPGEIGRAVILGHVADAEGGKDVFANLARAKVGDEVTITTVEDKTLLFSVSDVTTYAADEVPVEQVYAGSGDAAQMSLIAPAGKPDKNGNYPDKVVVSAAQVN